MVIALPNVPIAAIPLKMRSAIEIPLLIPCAGVEIIVDASPDSTAASAFIINPVHTRKGSQLDLSYKFSELWPPIQGRALPVCTFPAIFGVGTAKAGEEFILSRKKIYMVRDWDLARYDSFCMSFEMRIIRMSSTGIEDVKDQEPSVDPAKNQAENEADQKELDQNSENPMPSHEQEEEIIKKKYGGMLPKKPLISKDHEHAFFDSADWALGKQGAQKPKGPLEALRPKLQPTPHHQMRSKRSVYAPADDDDGAESVSNSTPPEDENCASQSGDDKNSAPEDQTCYSLPV
ncbi:unnamed protein product [Dovyalis caffra]|uniref:cAMP-regulated phosphoprotein 19-related protein n=2 Tax=Magnoliopsida TaxID=3398 RepID=A0AAV1R0P8_9ROSI|nr:unnamed protein product [Dovyalis caffra]